MQSPRRRREHDEHHVPCFPASGCHATRTLHVLGLTSAVRAEDSVSDGRRGHAVSGGAVCRPHDQRRQGESARWWVHNGLESVARQAVWYAQCLTTARSRPACTTAAHHQPAQCGTASQALLLEHNVRFGDPECQGLLSRLDSDLLPVLQARARPTLFAATLTPAAAQLCTDADSHRTSWWCLLLPLRPNPPVASLQRQAGLPCR